MGFVEIIMSGTDVDGWPWIIGMGFVEIIMSVHLAAILNLLNPSTLVSDQARMAVEQHHLPFDRLRRHVIAALETVTRSTQRIVGGQEADQHREGQDT